MSIHSIDLSPRNLSLRDKAVIWHPFTQHQTSALPLSITRGEGAYLIDEQGRRYLDLISSWWVTLHGHANTKIAEAIYQQALQLEQVIFAGFTHEPAVQLAEKLLALLNTNTPAAESSESFSKVFYSDNGSTAIEVAIKMAYQFWRNQGETQRKRFIAFHHGYHGDTFGAMAMGQGSLYFKPFSDLLFSVDLFDYPLTWLNDEIIAEREQAILTQLERHLEKHAHETAGLMIEPLVQGAGGMNMCRSVFLQALAKLLKQHNVLLIYDEVLTGFGRTGDYFAAHKSHTIPDIICLSKGLSGGFLPLSVTICQEKIYNAFLGEDFNRALAHSHSFTANPLGCAAALASLNLLQAPETQQQIKNIERIHREELSECASIGDKIRYCGTISAFNLFASADYDYGKRASVQLRERFLEKNLILRPLGNVIYLLPPYCISESALRQAYHVIKETLKKD